MSAMSASVEKDLFLFERHQIEQIKASKVSFSHEPGLPPQLRMEKNFSLIRSRLQLMSESASSYRRAPRLRPSGKNESDSSSSHQPQEPQTLNQLLSAAQSQPMPRVPAANDPEAAADESCSAQARELDERYAQLGRPRREYASDWEMAALQQCSKPRRALPPDTAGTEWASAAIHQISDPNPQS